MQNIPILKIMGVFSGCIIQLNKISTSRTRFRCDLSLLEDNFHEILRSIFVLIEANKSM